MNLTSPVKRATIFNRDMAASLALYRDILGFDVVEDKVISGPAMAKMVGLEDCTMHICHLQSQDAENGLIGLYCITESVPPLPEPERQPVDRVAYGNASVVLYSEHGDEIYARLEGRYDFVRTPQEYVKEEDSEYMKAGRYTEMIFRDPDDVLVSVMGYKPL